MVEMQILQEQKSACVAQSHRIASLPAPLAAQCGLLSTRLQHAADPLLSLRRA